MFKRRTVKSSTPLQLFKNFYTAGSLLEDAPLKARGAMSVPLSSLFDIDFGKTNRNRDDYFFMPGKHREKTYRYTVNDTDFDHKDEFDFFLIPIDIDLHTEDGREVWKDKKESSAAIKRLCKLSPLIDEARTTAASRGGIRVVFVCDMTVNSLEWRSLYENVVKEIAEDVRGEFGDYGKMTFYSKGLKLVLDGRNPGSLTRVPFGFRSGAPVSESSYFYQKQTNNFLSIERYGELKEYVKQYKDVSGYDLIDLTPEMEKQKRAAPRPDKLAELPSWLRPFSWHGSPPKQGSRELAIFHAVSNAKQEYKDSLTPEQYYSYFFNAIIVEMDTKKTKIPAEVQLWGKITRNWYVRSEADTFTGKKLDSTHFRNSGGKTFFIGKDFDHLKTTSGLFAYAKSKLSGYVKQILSSGNIISVLNPPPGAGKSTVARELFSVKPSLYIAPSYANLAEFKNGLGRFNINEVLSYKMLIPEIAEDEDERSELYTAYLAYVDLRKNSPSDLFISQTTIIKPYWSFIRIQFPDASKRLKKENDRRIKLLEEGEPSIITTAKFMTIVNREKIQMLHSDYQFIFDEATPEDIVNPEDYNKNKPVQVYSDMCEPPPLEDEFSQFALKQFMENRLTVLINADKGLSDALKHNSYKNFKVYGADMPDVLDNQAYLIFSPFIKAGYIKHRPDYDKDELSQRALMSQALNKEEHTIISNGSYICGKKISENNLVNVIGSNKFTNSSIISLYTCPTPEEIALTHFCTGLKIDRAEDLVIQNKVNQVLGRNTGYRSLEVHKDWMLEKKKGTPHKDNNVHYAILPEKYLSRDLSLIVKTTNVFTTSSKKLPRVVDIFLKPIDKHVTDRISLYNIEPGTFVQASVIAKKLKLSIRALKGYIEDNQGLFPDYSYKTGFLIDECRKRNVLYRHRTVQAVIVEALKSTFEMVRMKHFIKTMKDLSNERYIETMTTKELKTLIREEAFHYEYRSVMMHNVEYLCPTDEDFIFKESALIDLQNIKEQLV